MVRVWWLDTGLELSAEVSELPNDGCTLEVQVTRGEIVHVGKDFLVLLYENHSSNPTGHRIRSSIHLQSIEKIDIWQPEQAAHWERNVKRSRVRRANGDTDNTNRTS